MTTQAATTPSVVTFEKITKVSLPFDMRDDDPKKNYGVGGLRVWFILKGPKGATQFCVGFPMYLPHVEEWWASAGLGRSERRIEGWDVGYHARTPQYEDQSPMGPCDVFGGEPCYYDGSSLRAEDWAKEIFAMRGEKLEAEIWRRLEEEYNLRFGETKDGL